MECNKFLQPGTTKFFALLILSLGYTVRKKHDHVAGFTRQADFLIPRVVKNTEREP